LSKSTILAATSWSSNSALIADCAKLGYLTEDGTTLDPTYGRGNWWKVFRPLHLTIHDIKIDGVDFTNLPEADGSFKHVAFDPPYVSVGGRKTTKIKDFHSRYGMTDAPRTPKDVQALVNAGLSECARVLEKNGTLLVKVQDYVSSGQLWIGTHHTLTHALEIGLRIEDRFEHIGSPRPQPQRRQVHARRNLSTLFVFKKVK
jgi:tRNA G10  N-methylase Trm11